MTEIITNLREKDLEKRKGRVKQKHHDTTAQLQFNGNDFATNVSTEIDDKPFHKVPNSLNGEWWRFIHSDINVPIVNSDDPSNNIQEVHTLYILLRKRGFVIKIQVFSYWEESSMI